MQRIFHNIISASLSPNTDRTDVLQALRVFFTPSQWRKGSALVWVRRWFEEYLGKGDYVFFNSGRSALLALLQSFDIGQGDEVLVQAFTCVAVPNSVLWAGAIPVYVDIDDTYNMDSYDAEKKITKKTKVLIIQHTFGIPAKMDAFLSLAKKYKLLIIEDCAHALGATYKGEKVGTLGDASFFSFGRDKVVSSVWGGAAHINSKFKIQNSKLTSYAEKLPCPSYFWIFQQILHPIAFSIIIPLYAFGIGKVLLVVLQKLKLLSIPVYPEEKHGLQPREFPKRYPNALALLLKVQLTKLDTLIQQRRDRAQQYIHTLVSDSAVLIPPNSIDAGWLRFPIQVAHPEQTQSHAKQSGIMLGNWYHNVIDPTGVIYRVTGYAPDTCPRARLAAKRILNLPTNISKQQADSVLDALHTK